MAKKTAKKASPRPQASSAKAGKYVYLFGKAKTDGNGGMKPLLGGKGANLAEMTCVVGADRVPGGFNDRGGDLRRLHGLPGHRLEQLARPIGIEGLAGHQPQVREIVWYELAAPPAAHPPLWNTALLSHSGEPTPVFNALRTWIAHATR